MKKLLLGTALVALAGLTGLGATAQEQFQTGADPSHIRATDFIGQPIYATETAVTGAGIVGVQNDWNDIGNVNDVLLTRDGNVSAVLVDVGRFLGMGERQIAIRPASLYFVSDDSTGENADDFFLVMTAGRSVFESAPAYERGEGTVGTSGTNAGSGVTAMTDNNASNGGSTGTGTGLSGRTGESNGMTDGTSTAGVQALEGARGSAEGGISDRQTAEANATGTSAGEVLDGFTSADKSALTSDDLKGVRVYAPSGDDLGEISGLVTGDTGATSQVIMDIGGFLGFGAKSVAVDLASLDVMRAENGREIRAVLPMTRDQLDALPTVQ